MINLILYILIYNYTNYLSFFFLVDLNKRKLLINIGIALIIDYIMGMYVYNLIFILVIYLTTKLIKINMHNLLNYYLYNISIILMFIILICALKGKKKQKNKNKEIYKNVKEKKDDIKDNKKKEQVIEEKTKSQPIVYDNVNNKKKKKSKKKK